MTRKDYIVIAAAIRAGRQGTLSQAASIAADRIVDELCDALRADNPRFDTSRFREAAAQS